MTTDWRILEKKDYFISGYNQTWQNERCIELGSYCKNGKTKY